MDSLPGLGFDNLRNIDVGQVYNMNYTTCSISNDGYYLLPDEIYLIPVLNSEVDFYANVYDSFDNWKSVTTESINAEAKLGFFDINGKFSGEFQDTKTKMVNSKSKAVTIGLRHHLYSVHINADAQLHPSFKSRVLDLAVHIQNNNTELAHYLADLLVRDYGTHVVTSIEAGAGLYQTTFVSRDFMNSSETSTTTLSASAHANFFGIFKLDLSGQYTKTVTDINGFTNHTTHLRTSTYGGPPFKLSNFSYGDWENGIRDNLVAIDRRGEPLYTAITTTNIPELPDTLFAETVHYIYKAVRTYYKVNTHFGCTNPLSKNFNFQANLDDRSCTKNRQNYTFGGIYQTCVNHQSYDVCSGFSASQTNPLTSDHSCPNGYKAIFLHSGTLKKTTTAQDCHHHCSWFHCHTRCSQRYVMNYATYSAYWCAFPPGQTVPANSGYMFGGVYSSKHSNPVTGASTCPSFFYPLHFGEDINVCVSNDIEGTTYELPFGGFQSCATGNPLATSAAQFQQGNYPHHCPVGHNQFLVTVDQGCVINFCSKIEALLKYTPRPPIIPPYRVKAPMTVNVTDVLVIVGPHGTIWAKGDDGKWSRYKTEERMDGYQFIQSYMLPSTPASNLTDPIISTTPPALHSSPHDNDGDFSTPQIVGVVIGTAFSTAILIAFVAVVICGVSKFNKKRKAQKKSLLQLTDPPNNSGQNETTILIQ
jgi:hypothetical protein